MPPRDSGSPEADVDARAGNAESTAATEARDLGSAVGPDSRPFTSRQPWLARRPGWSDPGWFDVALRPEVRRLTALPVGPELLATLVALGHTPRCGADPDAGHANGDGHSARGVLGRRAKLLGRAGAPCGCLVVLAAAWAAVASWTELAAGRSLMAAVGVYPVTTAFDPADPRMGTITDAAMDEVAPGLRLSPGSAAARVRAVRQMADLPALLSAVAAGWISAWTARLVSQELGALGAGERDLIAETLVDKLRTRHDSGRRPWTGSEVRAVVKRIALAMDIDVRRARRHAVRGRRVTVTHTGYGMALLLADLPEDVAHRIYRKLDAIVRHLPGDDPRCRDEQRADVLADLILDRPANAGASPEDGGDPGANPDPGRNPNPGNRLDGTGCDGRSCDEVGVVIDLATLLGLSERPGEIRGCGPIPADVARELAADRRWRLWITRSADGPVIATSATVYRPSEPLARLVRARDPYCRFPGCRRTSPNCDLDHVVPWPQGQTTAESIGPLCRRHHRLKTRGDWQLRSDGTTTQWVSPNGTSSLDDADPPLPGP